ncbi:hypothetical protein DRO97_00775 [Archaeoglobales archaeon]|nr:MAG: hypothetical protein DRO97_00775 [Archaeoglobales archaeon]
MKLLALLSSGIDSPVACYLMLKKGFEIEYLHFSNSKSTDKIKKIVRKLAEFGGTDRFFQMPHSEMMNRILSLEFDRKYTCVMCKRSMLTLAELLANEIGCEALITGDNLGQVASQTISNIKVEEELIKMPVLRPLIGFDKVETVDIARKIGTYEISIEKEGSCRYVPRKPATKAKKLPKIDIEILRKLEVKEIKV